LRTSVPQTHEPPVLRFTLTDDDQNGFRIDGDPAHSSEKDTQKSFDFTGEIKRLNEPGASDRASFVEQLEMAFKTPAKIDLPVFFPESRVDSESNIGSIIRMQISMHYETRKMDMESIHWRKE